MGWDKWGGSRSGVGREEKKRRRGSRGRKILIWSLHPKVRKDLYGTDYTYRPIGTDSPVSGNNLRNMTNGGTRLEGLPKITCLWYLLGTEPNPVSTQ